jgi:Fe2+ transport system protein FeoA
LAVGAAGRVVTNSTEGGLISVEVEGRVTSLGRDVAEKLLVAGGS